MEDENKFVVYTELPSKRLQIEVNEFCFHPGSNQQRLQLAHLCKFALKYFSGKK